MSDHAEDVNKPVDQVANSSPAEQIESDAPVGDASSSDSSPETAKEESGAEKRIRELTWKRREAEREAEEVRKRAEEAERRLAELERRPEPAKADNGPPLESDYDDPNQYRRDLEAWNDARWEARQRAEQERQAKLTQEQQEQQRKQVLSEKLTRYATETEGFADDVEAAGIQPSPTLVDYLVDSEKAGEVLHYLAKNPEHAAKLEGLSPVASARELVRIEQTLEAASKPIASKAPEPISDIGDGDAGSSGPSPNMTTDEWLAKRRAQVASRRR